MKYNKARETARRVKQAKIMKGNRMRKQLLKEKKEHNIKITRAEYGM